MTEQTPNRVTCWENARAKGGALVADSVWQEHLQTVETLRKREAEYRASLPVDAAEAVSKALKILHPDGEDFPQGFQDALHMAVALEGLIRDNDLSQHEIDHNAAQHLARRIWENLDELGSALTRLTDILGNPRRLEREARFVTPDVTPSRHDDADRSSAGD